MTQIDDKVRTIIRSYISAGAAEKRSYNDVVDGILVGLEANGYVIVPSEPTEGRDGALEKERK